MSKIQSLLAMYGMAIASSGADLSGNNPFQESRYVPTKEELEMRVKVKEIRLLNKKLDNGLKKFYYQGEVIYARNKKNADRKARNLGYL